MRRISSIAVFTLLLSRFALAGTYDQIEADFKPYLSMDDPAGFAMKIRAASISPRALWGGEKKLFFDWSKENCADWLSAREHFVTCHGDVHLGNIGSYATKLNPPELAFGLVDFDEACKLPVEFDLLEAAISLQLLAGDAGLEFNQPVCERLIESYLAAQKSDASATGILKNDPLMTTTFAKQNLLYEKELDHLTKAGRFRSVIKKKGEFREILRPGNDRADALAQALASSASLKPFLRSSDVATIRKSIKDVALRTRLTSAGSQGLEKILILMDSPLKSMDGEIIIYLKQQIPDAADRADVASKDDRPAGRRVCEAVVSLASPAPAINAWCSVGDKSYSISIKEPWSSDLESADSGEQQISSDEELRRLAEIIGTVLGVAHRRDVRAFDDSFAKVLCDRSKQYVTVLKAQFQSLHDDPRTAQCVARTDAWIAQSK